MGYLLSQYLVVLLYYFCSIAILLFFQLLVPLRLSQHSNYQFAVAKGQTPNSSFVVPIL
jgi:predicted permease